MRQSPVARLLKPLEEAPDVAWCQPQEGPRLHRRQLLLPRLTNHRHPPEFRHTHDDPVLSDHLTLRVRAGQSRNEADMSTVANTDRIIVELHAHLQNTLIMTVPKLNTLRASDAVCVGSRAA